MYVTERQSGESGRSYALRVIKENIIRLELAPGSRISENEIALALGLSRTPIREALQELSREKVVEVYPQRGSVIALVDYDLVDEAQFMRKALECGVAERLALMQDRPSLTPLRENLGLQEYYLKEGNTEKLMELDDKFHETLFLLAGYENCYRMMAGLYVHFDRVRCMALKTTDQHPIVGDHRAILEALEECRSAQAVERMTQHLSRYKVDESELRRQYPDYFKK